MAKLENHVLKQVAKLITVSFLMGLLQFGGGGPLWSNSTWDSERLNIERAIQERVETALSKILPAGQFVLVVRVEPWNQSDPPKLKKDDRMGYFLPGVPERRRFDKSGREIEDLMAQLKPESPVFKKFIRRIAVTLVVDEEVPEDTVNKVRELTRQMVGLSPERGDTLDVQTTGFHKPVTPIFDNSTLSRFRVGLRNNWLLISLSLIVFSIVVFFLFIFGPLRGFLNRFVQVLPALRPQDREGKFPRFGGEHPFMPMGQPMGYLPGAPPSQSSNFSGMLQVENPNKMTLPFGFIREDHIGNLAILLSRESPEKAATVLGYLPPDWISRVLMKIDPALQTEIATQLATTRQLLPEQVEDIEQDLKRRLDYLVGGPDRILSIYESLDPEAQKRMLENLRDVNPEIADEIRQRSLLFEDLEKLDPNSLKALMREIDLQTLVLSLQGMPQSFVRAILDHVSTGKAEIVKEELELNEKTPGKATMEAQKKVTLIAKRLEREGHLTHPQGDSQSPAARYGGSLRETLKLPPGLKSPDAVVEEGDVSKDPNKKDEKIQDKIKRFMKREPPDKERFPSDDIASGQ